MQLNSTALTVIVVSTHDWQPCHAFRNYHWWLSGEHRLHVCRIVVKCLLNVVFRSCVVADHVFKVF